MPAKEFFKGSAAHDKSDRIIYDPDTGKTYYDANGSKPGQKMLFAILDDHLKVTYHDFHL